MFGSRPDGILWRSQKFGMCGRRLGKKGNYNDVLNVLAPHFVLCRRGVEAAVAIVSAVAPCVQAVCIWREQLDTWLKTASMGSMETDEGPQLRSHIGHQPCGHVQPARLVFGFLIDGRLAVRFSNQAWRLARLPTRPSIRLRDFSNAHVQPSTVGTRAPSTSGFATASTNANTMPPLCDVSGRG